jgi:toxin ParE1/3/4
MKLRVLDEAKVDALAAAFAVEDGRHGLGDAFQVRYEQTLQSISEMPESFARYEHAPKGTNIRRAVMRRFRYVVYFEVFPEEVLVYAVGHCSRRPNWWRKRRQSS